MPRRPPKRWFYRCVKRVKEEAPEVKNPQAFAAGYGTATPSQAPRERF